MHSFFFSFPIHILCQKQQTPTAGFAPAAIPVNCYPQPGLLCGCTKDPSDTQAWDNYWNIHLSPQNPTVLRMCMKISLDANQSINLGSEGGKKQNQTPVLILTLPFQLSEGEGAPNTLLPNTSLPQMVLLLRKTVHTMQGFCFTFNVWPSKPHRKAERTQDQKNQMWYIQNHLG